jgi:hypothetical protein
METKSPVQNYKIVWPKIHDRLSNVMHKQLRENASIFLLSDYKDFYKVDRQDNIGNILIKYTKKRLSIVSLIATKIDINVVSAPHGHLSTGRKSVSPPALEEHFWKEDQPPNLILGKCE